MWGASSPGKTACPDLAQTPSCRRQVCALEAWVGGAPVRAPCHLQVPNSLPLGCGRPGTRSSPQRPLVVLCRGALVREAAAGSGAHPGRAGRGGLCGGETLLYAGSRGQGPCRPPSSGLGRANSREPREGTKLLTRAPLVAVILEKPIRIPRFLSVKASHVLKGFLNKVHVWPPRGPSECGCPGCCGTRGGGAALLPDRTSALCFGVFGHTCQNRTRNCAQEKFSESSVRLLSAGC